MRGFAHVESTAGYVQECLIDAAFDRYTQDGSDVGTLPFWKGMATLDVGSKVIILTTHVALVS